MRTMLMAVGLWTLISYGVVLIWVGLIEIGRTLKLRRERRQIRQLIHRHLRANYRRVLAE